MFAKLTSWLFALCLLLWGGAVASAQSTATGEIRGTISDSTGAVIPKASVTVVNVDTGAQKVFTTNNDGLYDTVSTPNGRYKVTIAAPGFEKLVLGPITLDLGTITLNGRLKVGSESQEVVVTSDTAALLRTESGEALMQEGVEAHLATPLSAEIVSFKRLHPRDIERPSGAPREAP